MKTLLIVILALGSFSTFANTFCGQVNQISASSSIRLLKNHDTSREEESFAVVSGKELYELTDKELSLLAIAKANSLEVCVTRAKVNREGDLVIRHEQTRKIEIK